MWSYENSQLGWMHVETALTVSAKGRHACEARCVSNHTRDIMAGNGRKAPVDNDGRLYSLDGRTNDVLGLDVTMNDSHTVRLS